MMMAGSVQLRFTHARSLAKHVKAKSCFHDWLMIITTMTKMMMALLLKKRKKGDEKNFVKRLKGNLWIGLKARSRNK